MKWWCVCVATVMFVCLLQLPEQLCTGLYSPGTPHSGREIYSRVSKCVLLCVFCEDHMNTVLLSNYCTHAPFCHSFAHACSTALKTKAAALLTMALAIVLFAILRLLPAKALIWRS